MLIINPTYSALPESLHCKLTFLFFSSPSLSFSVPFLSRPFLFFLPFYSPSCSKLIHVKIIDDEEYEKNKNFFLELAEPRMVDMSLQKGVVPNLFLCLLSLSFSLSLALTLCQCLFFHCLWPPSSPQASLSLLCPLPLPELSLWCPNGCPFHPLFLHRCAPENPLSQCLAFILHLKLLQNHSHHHDSLPRRRRHLHKKRTGSLGAAIIYNLHGAGSHYYVKTRVT